MAKNKEAVLIARLQHIARLQSVKDRQNHTADVTDFAGDNIANLTDYVAFLNDHPNVAIQLDLLTGKQLKQDIYDENKDYVEDPDSACDGVFDQKWKDLIQDRQSKVHDDCLYDVTGDIDDHPTPLPHKLFCQYVAEYKIELGA